MSAPTTDVAICNLALDRLGIRSITSIATPTTEVEAVVARHYDEVRREILRRYLFNFAKKYTTLTASTTKTPAFGYSSAYALPADFLRLLSLGDISVNADTDPDLYDMSEGFIFTDYAEDDDTLSLAYVYDATTVTKFDPLFIRVLQLRLARALAYKFTLKNALINSIRDELVDAEREAVSAAGQEKRPRRIERSRLRDVRKLGVYYRDNRYVG